MQCVSQTCPLFKFASLLCDRTLTQNNLGKKSFCLAHELHPIIKRRQEHKLGPCRSWRRDHGGMLLTITCSYLYTSGPWALLSQATMKMLSTDMPRAILMEASLHLRVLPRWLCQVDKKWACTHHSFKISSDRHLFWLFGGFDWLFLLLETGSHFLAQAASTYLGLFFCFPLVSVLGYG